jgi:urease accessory protein
MSDGGGKKRAGHPPLEGEGRTAEGGPGWGDSASTKSDKSLLQRCHPLPAATRPTSPLQGEVQVALYRLMTFMSPAYPVGAFSYSSGIEWAVEAGDIRDAETLRVWLGSMIGCGSVFCDAVIFAAAHRAIADGDDAALSAAAELAAAFVGTKERLLETTAQGEAFVTITRAAWPCAALDRLAAAWSGPLAYPIAVGVACAGHGMAIAPALDAFLHGVVSNLVSAGVRLVPLGQTDGQRVLAALEATVAATAERALTTSLDDIGSATLRADIASMRHETQYTRLFRS